MYIYFFFFNDTATTEIYTLSLHDALPICPRPDFQRTDKSSDRDGADKPGGRPGQPDKQENRIDRGGPAEDARSEEHTSELQSPCNLVCRLLLEKKQIQESARHRR